MGMQTFRDQLAVYIGSEQLRVNFSPSAVLSLTYVHLLIFGCDSSLTPAFTSVLLT